MNLIQTFETEETGQMIGKTSVFFDMQEILFYFLNFFLKFCEKPL